MLDPATAIAVAALAYDVSKDLLKYLKSWKKCPEEVRDLRSATLWLWQTFTNVDNVLSRRGSGSINEIQWDQIVKNAEDCQSQLEALKKELEKAQRAAPEDFLQKATNQARRFKYFFIRGSLQRMMKNIKNCESNMHFIISILNLETTVDVLDEVRLLARTTMSVEKDRSADLRSEFSDLKQTLFAQSREIGALKQLADRGEIHRKHQEALLWLLPAERRRIFSNFHARQYSKSESGTGSWFFDGWNYHNWQAEAKTCLWLQGPVGCGKTVLFSKIARDLQERCYFRDNDVGDILMYFYFSHRDESLRELRELLFSCIAQIGYESALARFIIDFYEEYNTNLLPTAPTNEELVEFLVLLIKQLAEPDSESDRPEDRRQAFLVIDALDEIPPGNARDDVLEFLQVIRETGFDHLHILITSRSDDDIRRSLRGGDDGHEAPTAASELPDFVKPQKLPLIVQLIEAENINQDIKILVETEMKRHHRLKALDFDTQQTVIKRLTNQERPMFRWAALQLAKIKTVAANKVDETLETLPPDLESTYEKELTAVSGEYSGPVHNALRWLVHARRPIKADELLEACAFETAPCVAYSQAQRIGIEKLSSLLSGFVTVEQLLVSPQPQDLSSQTVSLAHFSVKEYLLQKLSQSAIGNLYNLEDSLSHKFLAACCLEYLLAFNTLESRRQQYPLRQYAWDSWAWHCVRAKHPDGLSDGRADDIRNAVSFSTFQIHGEANMFLGTVLWALIDWVPNNKITKLWLCLSRPYFYEELTKGGEITSDWRYIHHCLDRPSKQLRVIELLPSNDDFAELRTRMRISEDVKSEVVGITKYRESRYHTIIICRVAK